MHPGPDPGAVRAEGIAAAGARVPPWWPALTRYVAAMNAAWHAFAEFGRPSHPGLRVCFAMLAGLGPLHRERLVARGGLRAADPNVFLDTSSYGPRAVDAIIRELGVDALVYGSDRPVTPPRSPRSERRSQIAMRVRNPARLLRTRRWRREPAPVVRPRPRPPGAPPARLPDRRRPRVVGPS